MDAGFPKHGQIWLAALDPASGHEIGKTRPAVVVSNDRNNRFADTVTIIPLTSKVERIYPFETFLSSQETSLPLNSKARVDQIRTIDKGQLQKKVGQVPDGRLDDIKRAVKIHLSID